MRSAESSSCRIEARRTGGRLLGNIPKRDVSLVGKDKEPRAVVRPVRNPSYRLLRLHGGALGVKWGLAWDPVPERL